MASKPQMHREPFNQGLVTSRHSSLLNEGELTRADDTYYKANDPAIWRAWGRSFFLTGAPTADQVGGAAGKIKGLRYLEFDTTSGDTDNFLIAHLSNFYFTMVFSSRTNASAPVTSAAIGTGSTLDSAYFDNKYYLFNGNADLIKNQVAKSAKVQPTFRNHGLAPTALTPTNPKISKVAGSWPLDETFWGEGRFFFFTTEVLNPGDSDELESAFKGEPGFVDLQKSGATIPFDVKIERHDPLANNAVGEVRFYMIKTTLFQNWDDGLLARAVRVGTAGTSSIAANDFIQLSDSFAWEGSLEDGTRPGTADITGAPDLTISGQLNVQADDGTIMSVSGTSGQQGDIDYTDWGFPASIADAATIQGIQVYIKWRRFSGGGFIAIDAKLTKDTFGSVGASKRFLQSSPDFDLDVQPASSTTDIWGLGSLTGAQLKAIPFGLRLSFTMLTATTIVAHIDSIKIRAILTNVPTIGPNYSITPIQVANVITVHHSNLPPPISSTGDVYDGQMVVNDVDNPRSIRYSIPDQPDYFPIPYEIAMEDTVKTIRAVGDILVVWLKNKIKRINYLPLSTDSEYSPGRSRETIAHDHGGISTQSVALFNPPFDPPLAGYVSNRGVHATDGNRTFLLTEDLDWEGTVDLTALDQAILINYPKHYVLALHAIPVSGGGADPSVVYLFFYHPSQMKGASSITAGGRPRITGPNDVAAASATVARLLNEWVYLTGHPTDAKLYVEDNSVDDAEGAGINPIVQTRELYLSGPGRVWITERQFYHHISSSPSMTVVSTPSVRNVGGALVNQSTETFTTATEGLSSMGHHINSGGARFQLTSPDAGNPNNAAFSLQYLALEWSDGGFATDAT